jgi:glycosyltransferase involved in cell wall biosynthesis
MKLSSRSPKRVAYVLKRYPRYSETFVVNEILAHEAAGLEIFIFALRPPTDPHFQREISQVQAPVTYLCGEPVRADSLWSALCRLETDFPGCSNQWHACSKASGIEIYQAARLAQEIRDRQIEHIHAHFATTATAVARLSSLFTGTPYTFTAHAKDIFHESVDPFALCQKIEGAAGIVTVSDFNVRFLGAQFSECAPKLCRIYNGLDLDQFPFTTPDRRQPKIVAVGRLVEKKGFSNLVEACALLRRSGVDFKCEIIGGGELEAELRRRIEDFNLEDTVSMVGPRPLAYVKAAIRQAATLVVPSVTASTGDRDGLPTVLLEAMALGTPCIATSVTGIPEVVRHEETGLLVPERHPEALANAMHRLLIDADLRVGIAGAARCQVEVDFNIHQNAAKLRNVFSSCARPASGLLALAEVG